jgi:hypothetical protein
MSLDPLPGDPAEVAELGRRFRATADAIRSAATNLRRLGDEGAWDSPAGRQFRERAVDVANDVSKAEGRYQQAADALDGYHPELASAQSQASRAIDQFNTAQDDYQVAETQLQALAGTPPTPGDAYHQWSRRRDEANDDMDRARRLYQQALDARDRAANRAASALSAASHSDKLRDSWWDKIAPWVKKIADLASVISTVAGWLALAVACVPVIGDAAAGVLGTIALVAGLVALAGHFALAATGKGGWRRVGWDALVVTTGGAVRLIKVGKVAEGAAATTPLQAFVRGGERAATLEVRSSLTYAAPGSALEDALRGSRFLPGESGVAEAQSMVLTGGRIDVVASLAKGGELPESGSELSLSVVRTPDAAEVAASYQRTFTYNAYEVAAEVADKGVLVHETAGLPHEINELLGRGPQVTGSYEPVGATP